jgi:hypothetical protein
MRIAAAIMTNALMHQMPRPHSLARAVGGFKIPRLRVHTDSRPFTSFTARVPCFRNLLRVIAVPRTP